MEIKPIKTNTDYKEALAYIESLIVKGVEKDSVESEKLDILVTLVQDYESKTFIAENSDPIDAIEFVMDQRNLSQQDLVPIIGSRSKVSEVLSRKRPLSLSMIRALHDSFGIPAKVLLNQTRSTVESDFDYKKFPFKEMIKRGYIDNALNKLDENINDFMSSISNKQNVFALLSRTYYVRSARNMNPYSLSVWVAQIVNKAKQEKLTVTFKDGSITPEFMRKLADLTDEPDAINKVRDELKAVGIQLIAEPAMPETYLDGVAIMIANKNPIIGITIRHDRLDNFWFTLFHELSHIALHFGKGTNLFYDDIEFIDATDPREIEADKLAINVLIPEEEWIKSPASKVSSPDAAKLLAKKLSIHPSIVAGRMRYERKHYYFLNDLVGKGEVKKYFTKFVQS